MPPVGIILLTYKRTEYAMRTVASVCKHLKYDGELLWYVADDGSPENHYQEIRSFVTLQSNGMLYKSHQTGKRRGYGVNANKAWSYFHSKGIEITLWLEDDWLMLRDFDITQHVQTLLDGHAGMIRITYIPLNSLMQPVYHNNEYYLAMKKDGLYTYSGNPHLKHYEFSNCYGLIPEDRNPGDTEIAYDHIVRHTEGLPILVPAEIHDPPFAHIGEEKSYE